MRKIKTWTYEEIQFLKDNYLVLGGRKIAKQLDRSEQSVYKKAVRLGMNKNNLIPIGFHYCSKCKTLRPIGSFYINRLNKYCKDCNREYYRTKKAVSK